MQYINKVSILTITKGNVIKFNKCVKEEMLEGTVVGVYFRGEPGEYYDVRMSDNKIISVPKKEVFGSTLVIRGKKVTKPKVKKNCGCK